MKILFNIGCLNKGGAERVVANLSNFLVDNNEVSIVTTIRDKILYNLNTEINLYTLDGENPTRNILGKNIKRLKKLSKIVKEVQPDLIVSFLPEPSYRILFLKFFNRNWKVIVSVRNDPKIEYKSKFNKYIMKILYPLADGFVFQTEEAKKYFNKKIQEKSTIIPNPIADEFLNSKVNKAKKKIVINVGRLEEQKNQEMLIKAFTNVSKDYPEYKLFIYGEGSLRNKLKQLIEKSGMNQKIFLLGNVDNIIDKLNEAEIFVLSSKYEGMPNSLMEAMAMGLACIATDCSCGGPRFLIRNEENGLLVKEGSRVDLEQCLNKVMEDYELRKKLEKNAIEIREDLNSDIINNQWNCYFKQINGG